MKSKKKSILGPFANFRPKKIFSEKSTSATLFLDFCCCTQFQKKTNEQILRKAGYRHTDRWIHGCKDAQTSVNS